mgnify:CR=1 FL=1
MQNMKDNCDMQHGLVLFFCILAYNWFSCALEVGNSFVVSCPLGDKLDRYIEGELKRKIFNNFVCCSWMGRMNFFLWMEEILDSRKRFTHDNDIQWLNPLHTNRFISFHSFNNCNCIL